MPYLIQRMYMISGVVAGALFVVTGWFVDQWHIGDSLSSVSLVDLYINNSVHFVVLTAPLVLGGLGRSIDLFVARIVRLAKETKEESKYRLALGEMSEGIITMDSGGLIETLNPAAERLFGYQHREAIGRKLEILMPEKYRQHHEEGMKRYFSGKGSKLIGKGPIDLEGLTKSGEIFPISLNLIDASLGDARLVTAIIKDTTEVKRLQRVSERSAVELTQLIDAANAPIFGIDPEGRVNEWNQSAVAISGFDKAEVMGRDLVVDFITEEYKASVQEVFDLALLGKETANFEFSLYTKDEQRVEVLLNATTRRNVEGDIVGVIGVGQDITEVKRLQLESERSAAELTQLIDTANAPIFGIDPEGRVNEWNQSAVAISGFDKAEVMGRDLVVDFITEEYKASVQEVFDKALLGEDTANFEFPLYTKDEQRVEVLLNATTRRNADGNIVGVIGVGQDITVLREKELALQQSQKMEAVGQLTGGIAHDFNNLLSIIQGNLRFLQEDIGKTDDDIKHLFEDALSAVDDGSELTERLLRFSSNRNLQPTMQGVNITIEKFYRLMSRTIGEKISLDLKLAEEEVFVRVDPSQLDNSLINLVINARDAMPKGGEIIIMAELISYTEATRVAKQYDVNDLPNQEFVKVSVRDQGEGIEPDIIDRITEPFYTTKDVGAGTGLGLSMVYSFMKASGGFLRINSTVGEGTIVEMYFPSMKEHKNTLAEEVATSSESILSKTILVVEDEPRVRRVAIRTLRGLNYKTIEAENADMAISIIESGKKIDLVFSDILMPGEMDGRMLGDWVKEHYPEIKVVLTSGYSKGKADVKTPLGDENLTKYPIVRKPYRLNALADIIPSAFDDN
jgi:PAS domain S-box-containing protein